MQVVEAECEIFGTELVGDGADRDKAEICIWESRVRIAGVRSRGDAAWERFGEGLRARARRLVRIHRHEIEAVAASLQIRERLSGEEVDAVLEASART